jgi:hypothetical protein
MAGARRYATSGRALPRQRGFAIIGGILFALVAAGTTLYAISQADDKKQAVLEEAGFVIAGLIFAQSVQASARSSSACSACAATIRTSTKNVRAGRS